MAPLTRPQLSSDDPKTKLTVPGESVTMQIRATPAKGGLLLKLRRKNDPEEMSLLEVGTFEVSVEEARVLCEGAQADVRRQLLRLFRRAFQGRPAFDAEHPVVRKHADDMIRLGIAAREREHPTA